MLCVEIALPWPLKRNWALPSSHGMRFLTPATLPMWRPTGKPFIFRKRFARERMVTVKLTLRPVGPS